MLRILRAFMWLRWRVLLNSLERTGGRDRLERLSIAVEQLRPLIVFLLMVPSALALLAASIHAGRALAGGASRIPLFEVLRFLLGIACLFAIVGPILLPAGERTSTVRLLLLPISRAALYAGQVMSALADPWILLVVAIVTGLPLGLLSGGQAGGALAAVAAGILLLVVLAGLSLTVTAVVHLVARDRRRGELFALIFILVLPVLALLPGLLGDEQRRQAKVVPQTQREETQPWWPRVERAARATLPSELFAATIRSAAAGQYAGTPAPLAGLVATGTALHGVAFALFVHVLSSPSTAGSRRRSTNGIPDTPRLPGLSPAAGAVAIAQVRLALRTPRGRSVVLSPLMLFGVLAVFLFRSGSDVDFGFVNLAGGLGLATFGTFVSLLTIVPLAMNQFAIDGAGLTLMLLAPIETRALLAGKAVGNAITAAIPAACCLAGAVVLFPSGSLALWISIPLGLTATYLLVAPAAAVLSAIFPRAVDLNSIGKGSNAHGVAGLLGTLAFAVAGAPCLGLALLAARLLGRPLLAPVFLLGWTLVCAVLSPLLFRQAEATFDRRRENLGLVA